MILIATVVSIIIAVGAVVLLVWVFRPKSKELYDHCSKIPMFDEKVLTLVDMGANKRKKTAKKTGSKNGRKKTQKK